MATNLRRKVIIFGVFFIVALPFRNGLQYENGDWQMRSTLNVAPSCPNFVRFGVVVLWNEKSDGDNTILEVRWGLKLNALFCMRKLRGQSTHF